MKQSFLFFSILLLTASLLYSQSDYRITQEFKSRQRSFEIAIEYAKTPDELTRLKKEILEFKNEFRGNKELLNRALYPNNFESSFVNLAKKIEFTSKKIQEIEKLNTKVTSLETDYSLISEELAKLTHEVNTLRKSNSRLMNELKAYRSGYAGSKESIDSLKNLIAELKKGINQRDTLIKEIMDNIFATAEHKIESLDDAEMKGLKTQIQNTSLIDNITNLAKDNIDFLNASILSMEDLVNLRNEFNSFDSRWKHFGPKLFDIYSTDKQNKEKLAEIDSLTTKWNNALNTAVWNSINEEFRSLNIKLSHFTTGEEFEKSVVSYIDSTIRFSNTDINKEKNYIFFAQKVWGEKIKVDWMPILTSNNLITQPQIDTIDQKLDEWRVSTSGSKSIFIYSVIVILGIIIIISLYLLFKKTKQTDNSEIKKAFDIVDDKKNDLTDDEFIDDEK